MRISRSLSLTAIFVALIGGISQGHVSLIYPEGGETFTQDDTVVIEWVVAIDHGPCTWDLYYSSDSGMNWETLAMDLPKSQLTFNWVVPGDITTNGRIKVYMDNDIGEDYEDVSGDFTVQLIPVGIQVEIGDFYFDPQYIQVDIGDTVRWINLSASIMHTTTAVGGQWDSGTLSPGEYFDYIVGEEGVFDYLCSFHPGTMTGTIIAGRPDSVAADIQIADFSFVPGMVTVRPNSYVRWINLDNVVHTSTADDAGWDSGDIQPGGVFTLQFPDTGSYGYHCTPHPSMVGTVNVAGGFAYLIGDANMFNESIDLENPLTGPWRVGGDVTFLVNYFNIDSGNQPCLMHNPSAPNEGQINNGYFFASADATGDCQVLGGDVSRLVQFFSGNPDAIIRWCGFDRPDPEHYYPPYWLNNRGSGLEQPVPPLIQLPSGWPNCETQPPLDLK